MAKALVLSCSSPLGPMASLHAATNSSFSGPKAEYSCPDCRTRAERLRRVAGVLVKKATYQDLNNAVDQLHESARLFQQVHSAANVAENYLKIAEIYRIWGRYRQEMSLYNQALNLAGGSEIDLRCSILSHQALAHLDSDIVKSRKFSEEAVGLSERTPNPARKAEALEAFGEALMSNEPEKASEAFGSAIELFQQANDTDGEARAQLNAGYNLFHHKSSLENAFPAFKEALRLWTLVKNTYGMALSHRALGQYWNAIGEPQKAADEYDLAEPVFHAAHNREYEAIILSARGDVSAAIGNFEESLRYHHKARLAFSKIDDVRGEMAPIDGAAHDQWALHQPEMSRRLNEIKLRRARQLGLPRYEASALGGIADFYVFHGDFIKAESLYRQALALFRTIDEPIQEANILIRLGRLYSKRTQDEQAFSTFREALDIAQNKGQGAQSSAAHFEIATIYQRQHRLEDAQGEIEEVLKIIESQRTKVSDFDDRASYFASVHEYYQLYIEILMQLDQREPGKGFAQQALEAAEKSRARSLLDMLGFVPSALTLSEIRAEIRGDDIVLLEYALGKEHSYLWVIDEAGMTSHEISTSTQRLSQLADKFRNSLLAPSIHRNEAAAQTVARKNLAKRQYPHNRQELAKALLGPASPYLQRKRIIIVPDGFLQYVPFVALLPAGNSELVSLPSASTLKALRDASQKRPSPTAKVAVFADPVFEIDDQRVRHNSSFLPRDAKSVVVTQVTRDVLGSGYIPRLPQSHVEAQAIVKAFGKENVFLREGFDANRTTALQALGQYRFIHFATHGFLDTHHPALSGLVLSMVNKNGKGQEGYVRLKDIYQLKLSADLVVLSACESALGKDLESEGMIGLTRAFLYAGSSRIISTLWKVDDQATAELMKDFYNRLHQGESPSLALRGAQAHLATSSDWNSPYYWAAFVLQGEYRWTK